MFRVPEAATMLLSGGHSFANLNKLQQYIFQGALLKLMLALEDAFITLARSTHSKCIVLCDRGTMDCRRYIYIYTYTHSYTYTLMISYYCTSFHSDHTSHSYTHIPLSLLVTVICLKMSGIYS